MLFAMSRTCAMRSSNDAVADTKSICRTMSKV